MPRKVKAKPLGRPKLSPERKREKVVKLRLNPSESVRLEAMAGEAGQTVSAYLRTKGLAS